MERFGQVGEDRFERRDAPAATAPCATVLLDVVERARAASYDLLDVAFVDHVAVTEQRHGSLR